MDKHTRKLLDQAQYDQYEEYAGDFQIDESYIEDDLYYAIKNTFCNNLHDNWVLSSHGQEKMTSSKKSSIILKPNEIVIMNKYPGMPIPVDDIVDKQGQETDPLSYYSKFLYREYAGVKYSNDFGVFSGHIPGLSIPNLVLSPEDVTFISGLFKMPLKFADKCKLQITKGMLLSDVFKHIRSHSKNGFTLMISACRYYRSVDVDEEGYAAYRKSAYKYKKSEEWIESVIPIDIIQDILAEIQQDIYETGHSPCFNQLKESDPCTGLDYYNYPESGFPTSK